MSFELKVNAVTAQELSHLVGSLAQQFGINLGQEKITVEASAPVVEKVEPEVVVEEKPKKEKKVATTKKEVEAPKTEQKFTKQAVADACQKVSTAKSLTVAKEILASFANESGEPCKRISDLKEVDYTAFLAACDKAIA